MIVLNTGNFDSPATYYYSSDDDFEANETVMLFVYSNWPMCFRLLIHVPPLDINNDSHNTKHWTLHEQYMNVCDYLAY